MRSSVTFELRYVNGWSYYSLPELEAKGIVHGFFTKESPSHTFIGADRNAFLEAFALHDIIVMDQEHGDEIHIVTKGERPDRGDGIILVEPQVAAIIKTADCLPVIIADTLCPMVAIVHAGWRGTAKKITQKAVEKMVRLGAGRENMIAILGPSIRSCCYEVGGEVLDIFQKEGFSERVFVKKNDVVYLDLSRANRELLAGAGIETIYDTGLCTYCTDDLFASYRKGEQGSRQINFVSLRR
ncbi:MAG: peptidoglycan editing factor PgeF [Syntrophus sp. (in: bacteria)]|nr:peptidoglycan editing factor PgeF [Syntrophus sp. (in: bacteria)]